MVTSQWPCKYSWTESVNLCRPAPKATVQVESWVSIAPRDEGDHFACQRECFLAFLMYSICMTFLGALHLACIYTVADTENRSCVSVSSVSWSMYSEFVQHVSVGTNPSGTYCWRQGESCPCVLILLVSRLMDGICIARLGTVHLLHRSITCMSVLFVSWSMWLFA